MTAVPVGNFTYREALYQIQSADLDLAALVTAVGSEATSRLGYVLVAQDPAEATPYDPNSDIDLQGVNWTVNDVLDATPIRAYQVGAADVVGVCVKTGGGDLNTLTRVASGIVKFDFDNPVQTSLAADDSGFECIGYLFFWIVGGDGGTDDINFANDHPLFWVDNGPGTSGGYPFQGEGSNVTLQINTNGFSRLKPPA